MARRSARSTCLGRSLLLVHLCPVNSSSSKYSSMIVICALCLQAHVLAGPPKRHALLLMGQKGGSGGEGWLPLGQFGEAVISPTRCRPHFACPRPIPSDPPIPRADPRCPARVNKQLLHGIEPSPQTSHSSKDASQTLRSASHPFDSLIYTLSTQVLTHESLSTSACRLSTSHSRQRWPPHPTRGPLSRVRTWHARPRV